MMLTAVTCACLTVAAMPAAPTPVEASRPPQTWQLQYRFQEGETVRYRLESQSTLLALKGEVREKTYSKSVTDQRLEIAAVEADGSATLRLSIASAEMEYAFNDAAPTVLSSATKSLPDAVAAVVGRPLAEVRLNPDGTTAGIEPLLTRAEINSVPGKMGLDGDTTGALFVKLPEQPVAIGDEWHDTLPVRVSVTRTLSQEVSILKQYRLESVEDGIAVIRLKSSVLTPVSEPAMLVQLIQRTSSGTIRFDIDAGRIVEQAADVDNTEIGWHGPDSSLRAIGRTSSRLVVEPTTVSSR